MGLVSFGNTVGFRIVRIVCRPDLTLSRAGATAVRTGTVVRIALHDLTETFFHFGDELETVHPSYVALKLP